MRLVSHEIEIVSILVVIVIPLVVVLLALPGITYVRCLLLSIGIGSIE
jgi:hypothetical protein